MGDSTEVIDGTAVEETIVPGVAIEPVEDRGVLMPVSPEDAAEAMAAYQKTTEAILDPTDWQEAGWDAKAKKKRYFVKKSGWRKIAKAYRLSCQLVSIRVERNAEGRPERAEAVVRASAPNGQFQDGDGYCSGDEPRFTSARADVSKLENDLRATATTRAKNRAISDLVGFGEVSAEEIGAPAAAPGVVFADAASEREARDAIIYITAGEERGAAVAGWFIKDQGGFPLSAARLVIACAKALRHATDVPAEDDPPPEAGDPDALAVEVPF